VVALVALAVSDHVHRVRAEQQFHDLRDLANFTIIDLDKAMSGEVLLATRLNGAPLPPMHGFPLRAVVPGWAGDSWTKWVTTVRVLDAEHDGFWMTRAYRHPGRPVAPGTAVPPEQMQPPVGVVARGKIFPRMGAAGLGAP
jgi:DMSO/TMAO reductase YedYZ molybdopterin-dependent catalytic subunit